MKILFVSDVEPNPALMKIARMEINQKNEVGLHFQNPDRIYVSSVFDKNKYQEILGDTEIIRGGRAYNPLACLPPHIEHLMPYYELYNLDYSMGFTSRGCIRHCKFCDNWIREGSIRDHAPISEWWDNDHTKVVVLDNNFLASSKWKENIGFIIEHSLKVNFHQGLDIRLVNNDNAQWLSMANIENLKGTGKEIHWAFDDLRIADQVVKGVKILSEHGIKRQRNIFYLICGFWNQDIHYDLERIRILHELGCQPYVMLHKNASGLQRKLGRWVNGVHGWRKGVETFKDYSRLTLKERMVVRV